MDGLVQRIELKPRRASRLLRSDYRGGVYFFPVASYKTLSYFDFATRRVRPILTVEKGAFFGLSVSPDQRYLLFTQMEDLHSDIMVVDNPE